MNTVIIVDVETSGLNPERGDRVLEVAAIRIQNNEIHSRFHRLINVQVRIPPQVRNIHGITPAELLNQPFPQEVWSEFSKFIGDVPLVAHNAQFDIRFIRKELHLAGLELNNRSICTLHLSREKFPFLPNHKLETVARFVLGSIPADIKLHRAMGDARLTAEIWMKINPKIGAEY